MCVGQASVRKVRCSKSSLFYNQVHSSSGPSMVPVYFRQVNHSGTIHYYVRGAIVNTMVGPMVYIKTY